MILPKAVRDQLNWTPGTRLVVESTNGSVVLKAEPIFAPTRMDDVFGSLTHKGPAKTIAEMDAGVMAEARRRHARY